MSAITEASAEGIPRWMGWMAGSDPAARVAFKLRTIQLLIVLNVTLVTAYILWRGVYTINWVLWPFSLALLGAELYSYVDTLLFGLGMWKMRIRGEPPAAPADATVDVFITCYNEGVDLVRATARAARDIHHPHKTWVLDDGDSAEMRAMAEQEGVGYITRGATWRGKDRHAKAGNLINALFQTDGQFLLVLDADQVPKPEILSRTLGYFDDPKVALVQTPQWFSNVPEGDPFGVDSPLFYGPIQQGKDGWNSAFFCGSNAVLRRDALMFAGIVVYAKEMEARVRGALKDTDRQLRQAARSLGPTATAARQALQVVRRAGRQARKRLNAGAPLQEVTWEFQRTLEAVSRELVARDVQGIYADLASMPGVEPGVLSSLEGGAAQTALLSGKGTSPLAAMEEVRKLLTDIDVDRSDQAEPVHPLATISITEDMATAMRLHGLGFRSVYHHEILAVGLAPDDLRSVLQQRLRWAQGTMQVLFRENPLLQRGLSWPQKLMYFSTMWSYLSGFAGVVYLLAPAMYLYFGLLPVNALTWQFMCFLLPCLVVNQLLFALIGYGMPTWRGQQYSLALFPLWIRAVITAFQNVYFGSKLPFVVTPKTRQGGVHWSLVRPQLAVTVILAGAILVGLVKLAVGTSDEAFPIVMNMVWAVYGIVMLSVVLNAARWQPAAALTVRDQ
ncbi:MAG: glycosyltransferase [Pseudomonadota bacterium]|nr:glycosyltransferase [Pseudomonadota bacterium]